MVNITIDNATKTFGKTVAVNDVSLKIKDKEFFILLGPSGSGKTTLLNAIAGFEPLDNGNIYFNDECIDPLPPEKRDIAMVFQSYALYPHMNVYDNISFSLKIHKVPKDDIEKRVTDTSSMLGIRDLLKRKPYELSGGERQRVALARAIVRSPKAFLMDEPMSNLDAKLRVGMRAELIRLQKKLETTTIYVTHDQVEAMTMADRVAILDVGRVQQVDPPTEIYKHPENLFVGGFIGSPAMNFFDCSWSEKDNTLDVTDFQLEIPKDIGKTIKERASSPELILGIRPQHLSVCKERETPQCVSSEIYAIEPLGSETLVDLKVGDKIIRVVVGGEYMGRIGDKTWMNINVDRIFLFDRKTEKTIV